MKKAFLILSIISIAQFSYAQWTTNSGNTITTDNVTITGSSSTSKETLISNTNNSSSTADVTLKISSGGTNGGSPKLFFDVSSFRGLNMGLDNGDDSKFKISAGAGFRNGDYLTILTGTNAGNIGIGTASPDVPLVVNGDTRLLAGGIFRLNNPANNASSGIYTNSSNSLLLQTGGSDRIAVNSSGNVGIGTTSPGLKLHIAGATSQGVQIEDATLSRSTYMTQENGFFTINAGGGNGIKLISDGSSNTFVLKNDNVGIGTTSPTNKLEVDGGSSEVAVRISTANTGASAASLVLANSSKTAFNDGLQIIHGAGVTKFNDLAGTNLMSLDLSNGKVGIGTTSPGSYKLALSSSDYRALSLNSTYGQVNADFANSGVYFGSIGSGSSQTPTGAYNDFGIGTAGTNGNLVFATGAGYSERLRIQANGNVLIGKTSQANSGYKLDVNGSARANEVVVNSDGADFVFEPDYKLPKLSEVKTFIDKNHHLPEIPSATEMKKNGMNIGELNTKLLQKVEELTLYLIEKDKQVNEQKSQLSNQQEQINQLKEQVTALIKAKN